MIATTRHQFTVSDYHRMIESGIFKENDRVELLDGEIYQMSPFGPMHIKLTNRLTKILVQQVGDDAIVSVQNTVQLNDWSEPQPDIAIVHPRVDSYDGELIQANDVYLLIEIADSSLHYDREEKLPRYASAAIPEVWIIDVKQHMIEQYTQPLEHQYTLLHRWLKGQTLTATTFPQIQITIDELFRSSAP